MSSVKQYQDKGVVVNYHPEEKVIHLQLKPGINPDHLKHLEDKIKTTLTVDSTDRESSRSELLKLGDNTQEMSVHEFLQSVLQGGQEIEDAGDVGDKETNTPETQPPLPAQPGVMPGGAPPTSPGQLPRENFNITDAFGMLWEGTYRTGEHWDILSQAIGKGKQQIEENDVLSLRRAYTKKKRSRGRDKVLRALDRVARYFVRKLRNTMGPDAARLFKERYKKIGGLTPLDYAEDTNTTTDNSMVGATPPTTMEPNVVNPQQVDFSEFFPKDKEDEYEDEEEEDIDPSEEYGEEEEEEYPD